VTVIFPELSFFVKQRLLKALRRCRSAAPRTRYLVIILLSEGRSVAAIASAQKVHRATVHRTARRFRQGGELGLLDRRAHNGPDKLNDRFCATLDRLVRSSPQHHGHRRPTWTRALLAITLSKLGHARVHVATLSRALARIRARGGAPSLRWGCCQRKAVIGFASTRPSSLSG
jgi:transposase